MKKIFLLICILLLTLTSCGNKLDIEDSSKQTTSSIRLPTLQYKLTDKGSYEIYAINNTDLERVIDIPETINGISVTSINLIKDCNIGKIIIPKTISFISFNKADINIDEAIIDPKNEYFDSRNNCKSINITSQQKLLYLTNFGNIDESLRFIDKYAFKTCDKSNLFIPKNIVDIKYNGSTKINKITVDKNNAYYDSRDNCNAIIESFSNKLIVTSISSIIPNTVEQIADFTLENFSNVILPRDLKTFNDKIFGYEKNVEYLKVDENNPYFDSRDNCNAIIDSNRDAMLFSTKNAIIPNSVKRLEENSLYSYKSKEFYIHENLEYIDDKVLYNLSNVETIKINENNPYFDSRDNCNAIIDSNKDAMIFTTKTSFVPDGIKRIENGCFKTYNFKDLYIPNSVEFIDGNAFYDLSNVESIKVNRSNKFYYSPFRSNCIIDRKNNKLIKACKNTKIPNDVEIIGSKSFHNCKIAKLNIPKTVIQIEQDAFDKYLKIEKINVDGKNKFYDSRDKCNCLIETKTNKLIIGSLNGFVPDGVEIIDEGAFYFHGENEIIIPKSVKTIKENAFYFDYKSIPYYTFYIYIPNTVETIEMNAFKIPGDRECNVYIDSENSKPGWSNHFIKDVLNGRFIRIYYKGNWPENVKNPYL